MSQSESSKRRAKHKALGLCTECTQKAAPGRTRCKKHLDYIRQKGRESYQRIKAEKKSHGICMYSGCNDKAIAGHRFCGYHEEQVAEAREKREAHYYTLGKCRCGRDKREEVASCDECLASRAAHTRRVRANRTTCACGRPRKTGTGKTGKLYARCPRCLEAHNKRNRQRKREQRQAKRELELQQKNSDTVSRLTKEAMDGLLE